LDILNHDSLSNKLLPLSIPDATVEDRFVAIRSSDEDKNDSNVVDFYLNADELRHLEEAFSDLSTGPRDTGAIATATIEKVDGLPASQSSDQATNVSSLPSLPSDPNDNQDVAPYDDQENQPPVSASEKVYTQDLHSNSLSDVYFYGRPLSTIVEWQSRESFSSTTAYQGKSQMHEKTGEAFAVNETPEDASGSVFMSKLPSFSHSLPQGPRRSGI
uniref:Protein kinase domain-containing protein n=1 Tax=Hydatigena taeniaeformis TaxID=6205 RepID=A0A0R3WZ53_HYDTA